MKLLVNVDEEILREFKRNILKRHPTLRSYLSETVEELLIEFNKREEVKENV